jgi:hypothetical protein
MKSADQRRNKTGHNAGRLALGAAALAVSASAILALTPTKASAFDIGGLIGTAMALQMGQYHGGYIPGGHGRTRTASHHDDSDSSDGGNSGVERDARDPVIAMSSPSGKSDNHIIARAQKTQGPSSSSGGIAQASVRDASVRDASERDAAAGEPAAPAFNPSR